MPIAPDAREARERLADAMEQRRLDLGLRWQDVSVRGGVSLKALHDARRGTAGISPRTRRAIERGLRWPPGEVGRLLDGREPASPGRFQLTHGAGDGRFTDSRERDTARAVRLLMTSIVDSVRRDIDEALARNPAACGRDIFAADDEAGLWDITDLLPYDERVSLVAHLRCIRMEEEPGHPGHLMPRRAG